jgi:hypothetical protein
MTYAYDHSQPVLVVNGQLRGKSGGPQSFQWAVDDGFTSHGLFLDNAGDVFAIQTDADDGLYVVRYQPGTEESQVLKVGPSGSRRNRFIPHFGADGKVYVANVTESRAGALTGVMVSTFDFRADRVEEVQFHPISVYLQEKMSPRLPEGRYDLVTFEVNAQANGYWSWKNGTLPPTPTATTRLPCTTPPSGSPASSRCAPANESFFA